MLSVAVMFLTLLALLDTVRLLRPSPSGTEEILAQSRNFYGTVSVTKQGTGDPQMQGTRLYNGRIVHGVQRTHPSQRRWPTTYYSETSGVGRVWSYYRVEGPMRVGAIGLGVGTLAAYAEQGDVLRFYEINPEVTRLAETHFTFLADARLRNAAIELVLGDGRLGLAREMASRPQALDLLVLDAFSGDAIPNHLLTKEAFSIYEAHLSAGGTIAVHISNRVLNLAPVVWGLARHFGWESVRIVSPAYPLRAVARSEWIILTRNAALLGELRALDTAQQDQPPAELPLWTDQYHNLFEILR